MKALRALGVVVMVGVAGCGCGGVTAAETDQRGLLDQPSPGCGDGLP